MIQVEDPNGGKPIDYTDKVIEKADECIQFLELVKERATDDCPYDVEFNAGGAKCLIHEICDIVKKVSDHYEKTVENCANEARPDDRKRGDIPLSAPNKEKKPPKDISKCYEPEEKK